MTTTTTTKIIDVTDALATYQAHLKGARTGLSRGAAPWLHDGDRETYSVRDLALVLVDVVRFEARIAVLRGVVGHVTSFADDTDPAVVNGAVRAYLTGVLLQPDDGATYRGGDDLTRVRREEQRKQISRLLAVLDALAEGSDQVEVIA